MLDSFAPDIFTVTRKQKFWGVECGTRATIVRLSDGGLFVHCPVALDPDLKREVDALGPVRVVVAASLFHHLYVGQWMDAYPGATVHGCPGLEKKRSDLKWTSIVSGEPFAELPADLDVAPFTSRFEHEVVFYHRATRTMICADALLNLSKHPSRMTRVVAALMMNTGPGKGYLERIAVRDWKLGRKQVDRILQWEIDRIALAHGGPVEGDGNRVIREAYSWL
jgi:hypothetical protein